MSAPKNNTNAARHCLTIGELPKGFERVTASVRQFRRSLEAAMLEANITIGVAQALTIVTAAHWHRHGLLAARWLKREADKGTLSAKDRLEFSREVAKASAERDRHVRLLGLDAQQAAGGDPWAELDLERTLTASKPAEVKLEAQAEPVASGAQLGGDYD